jgi:ketosteroid isomerase-like protein
MSGCMTREVDMGGADNRPSEIDEEAFRGYIAAFNRNDFDGLARYYADDIEFVGRAATLRGRDELLSFYQQVKSRVRETIAIQDIVAGERTLVADLITELHPLEDWPDFPTGPLRKGQTRRSQNFVWYDLAERRFIRIRAAHYRRVEGVIFEPIGIAANPAAGTDQVVSHRGRTFTPEEFAAYIDAFNRGDYIRYSAYYDPEVVLVTGGHHELRGPQAICDFYQSVRAQTQRTVHVRNLVCVPGRIAAELESEFLALQDIPDFTAGPMKKGERMFLHTVVLYEVGDERFVRIRSASLRKQLRG